MNGTFRPDDQDLEKFSSLSVRSISPNDLKILIIIIKKAKRWTHKLFEQICQPSLQHLKVGGYFLLSCFISGPSVISICGCGNLDFLVYLGGFLHPDHGWLVFLMLESRRWRYVSWAYAWVTGYSIELVWNLGDCAVVFLDRKLNLNVVFCCLPSFWVLLLVHRRMYLGVTVLLPSRDLELIGRKDKTSADVGFQNPTFMLNATTVKKVQQDKEDLEKVCVCATTELANCVAVKDKKAVILPHKIGHLEKFCSKGYLDSNSNPNTSISNSMEGKATVANTNPKVDSTNQEKIMSNNNKFGPWIHVDYGKKRAKNNKFQNKWVREVVYERKIKNEGAESHDEKEGDTLGKRNQCIFDSWPEELPEEVNPIISSNIEVISSNALEVIREDMVNVSAGIPKIFNKYEVLENMVEEREIVCQENEAIMYPKNNLAFNHDSSEKENIVETESFDTRFNHFVDGSSKVKKKGAKQLKSLGPIKMVPRSRRFDGEVEERLGSLFPSSH
ncbi:hypothetical protein MA16_Dca006218 [Dendrobium catenatum]|uniref:Uncharacterized protein n=1 Tax=Dendrobium catenatum TaxID=906689 RepID=A0A2I0X4U0_9ASPA|nr:hypothetical protein MA16_Dca006218 [Dendrobium catenatum]